jgi:uncharacterized DUF497 family protein
VRITFDRTKRDKTLRERGLDFEDASIVFAGTTVETEDTRHNYGEPRMICYGLLAGRLVVIGYTQGDTTRLFSACERQRS